jgi:plastocyanin
VRHLASRLAIVSIGLSLALGPISAAQAVVPFAFSQAAAAQDIPPSVAIVVGNPSDLTSWGYAPTVPLGQAVTWTNIGAQPHTVTFQGIGWDTGIMESGAAATLVLDVPGLYTYLCALHPTMTGSVLVSENLAATAPSMTIIEPDPGDIGSWGYALNIQAGQSVTWWNADDQPHTATASDVAWDTGTISPGDASAFPFDEPGTYAYICTPHPWMKATLQVTAATT